MFDDFEEFDLEVSATAIHGRRGGAGPPLLLLHGIPETHLMWRSVAPVLAQEFTVVVTDLRGYGASGVKDGDDDHERYAMRELAIDQVEVIGRLGFPRFGVAGHDRGARCAYRMALDHPAVISALAVLDIVPTADAFGRADRDFALGYWVWSFLAAPAPVPERLIRRRPGHLRRSPARHLGRRSPGDPGGGPAGLSRAVPRSGPGPRDLRAVPCRGDARCRSRRGRAGAGHRRSGAGAVE